MGDAFHGPTQITETDRKFSFDMDGDQGVATRTAVIERAESEDAIIAVCHHGGFGRVVPPKAGATGNSYRTTAARIPAPRGRN